MPNYRRAKTPGGTYFFTLVTYRRQQILCDEPIRQALRQAIRNTRLHYPFSVDVWVLMPDHLHCLWTLPDGDDDFSTRWSLIKRRVSIACKEHYKQARWKTPSKEKHRESTLWQRRFWEHCIRDQRDFNHHADYMHYNPGKHGLCNQPVEWSFSTVHRYINVGKYPENWTVGPAAFMGDSFGE